MNSSAQPRVSVIIAAHNRPDLLAEGVASVSRQTYPVHETIVVDDGSTPPLDLSALRAAGGEGVRIVRHDTPKRTAGAKNTGILSATGDLITFLDDDDLYAPTYVENAVRVMVRYPEREVLFTGVSWFGKLGPQGEAAYREGMDKVLEETTPEKSEPGLMIFGDDLFPALLHRVPMAFQRFMIRRAAFDRIGLYREGCALQDCDWALRAARISPCALTTEGLYLQRTEGQGTASRPQRLEQHLRTRIEINEYLLQESMRSPTSPEEAELLRRSLGDAWFDLAYHYGQVHKPMSGAKALLKSQKWHHVARRWRLAGRLIATALLPKPAT